MLWIPGTSVIIRDCHGQVMVALVQSYLLLVSVEVAKAMTILRGIQYALELGIMSVGNESDASTLVHSSKAEDPPLPDVGFVIYDIIQLKVYLSILHVNFISCKCNEVAHKLTRHGLLIKDSMILIEDVPPCVEALILAESQW
ncbi:hypothetical protein ACOSP7_022026 [Xanthoceras sorbifolium]